jgi:hypothetical protein
LARITTPQTLKIEGYIKNKMVIVLIDSGSTHNFIHSKTVKDLNCFIYLAPEFQVMVANGEIIKCSRKFHNIKLSMGEYVLNRENFRGEISPMGYFSMVFSKKKSPIYLF